MTRHIILGLVVGLGAGLGLGLLLGSETPPPLPRAPLGAPVPTGAASGPLSTGRPQLAAADPGPLSDERRGARAATTAPVQPSAGELQRAAREAASAVPEVVAEAGTGEGVLTGQVLLPEGTGLAGVVVRAVPSGGEERELPDSDAMGGAAEPMQDIADVLAERARAVARVRSQTFEVRTDAGGAYRMEGVPDGLFELEAFREGYSIRARRYDSRARPGEALDFLARPVRGVPVSVLMPDGSEAESAELYVAREGSDEADRTFAWEPGRELRLTTGVYEVKAYAGELELDAGPEVLSMSSPEQQFAVLESGSSSPLVLELEPRTGLHGRVLQPANDPTSRRQVRVIAQRAEVGEPFDPDEVARRAEHEVPHTWGRYAILDLEPGRYAVAVKRTSDTEPTPEFQFVELTGGLQELDLELRPQDLSGALMVQVLGPEGVNLERVRFSLRHRTGNSTDTNRVSSERQPDGRFALRIRDEDGGGDLRAGTPGHSFELVAGHSIYGETTIPLAPGQREALVSFETPASLLVRVAGLTGAEHEERIYVSADGQRTTRGWGSGLGGRLEEDGTRTLEGLAPGTLAISLSLRASNRGWRWNFTPLARAVVDLKPGRNELTLNAPALYQLDVQAKGLGKGTRVSARRRSTGDGLREFTSEANLDESGLASISELPAGTYKVTAGNRSAEVQVPSSTVVLQPKDG